MAGQEADEELAAELAEVAGVFAIFDTDGSGQLSASEVGARHVWVLGTTRVLGTGQWAPAGEALAQLGAGRLQGGAESWVP